MENRYLYRAKHIHVLPENEHLNGTWVTGYLSAENYISNEDGEFLIDPSTICQCTGLHDATRWDELSNEEQQKFLSSWNFEEDRKNKKEDWNGKLIWENDVVETIYDGKQNPNYVVIWDKDDLGFLATNGKEHYETHCEYLGCCEEIIVIGNIFDNPELLEVGE